MAHKKIREYDAKRILANYLKEKSSEFQFEPHLLHVDADTALSGKEKQSPWVTQTKLVAKPDQLIKRRGKHGLLGINLDWAAAKAWIAERTDKTVTLDEITDTLNTFLVEPFVPHEQENEHYIAITTSKKGDEILFCHEGGVDVGDVDAKAKRLFVPIETQTTPDEVVKKLLSDISATDKALLAQFICELYTFFVDTNCAFLEINPLVFVDGKVFPLDLAIQLDDTGVGESGKYWGEIEFPSPFGRTLSAEEKHVEELDSKTGASLKLTVLNQNGRVWTMVAGGGASVIYADTVVDLGAGPELANYGEYSGNPNEEFTYEYARTILDLMTRHQDARGKVLLIGGGIANFTDVAKTFKGIIKTLKEFQVKIREHDIRIFVRRGGPNYQEGLANMKKLGAEINIPIEVYGPETHMTYIVRAALKGEHR